MKKIQKEKVICPSGKSFRIFSPSLRNHFYWHYHPEYELVYVQADAGIRHVGSHISGYNESDLVFIGPNVPHLNFDYRVRNDYHQVVVQIKEDFLGNAIWHSPELFSMAQLFKNSGFGLSFHGKTKSVVAEKLLQLSNKDNFVQLMGLLEIFNILATSNEVTVLSDENISLNFFLKDKIRMGSVYEYINANYHNSPNVNIVAEKMHLTTPAFCRYFKKQTRMTFTDFVNQYRIDIAKNLLLEGKSITEACYAVGFGSLSYFSRLFKKVAGKNPSEFRKNWH